MSKEKDLFTVSENENMAEEIICVAEEELDQAQVPIIVSPMPQISDTKKEKESTNWRESKHPKHFVVFLVNELNRLPKPADARGSKSMLEKALGMYNAIDGHCSKALRSDYDDEIDVKKVDEIRNMISRYRDEVQDALDGIDMMTKQRRQMRRRRAEEENGIVKEATTPSLQGIQLHVSAFERAIVGAIINGVVSGGRNVEELYKEAKEKYKFTDREELALLQILEDFGYPVFKDRLMVGEKDEDPTRNKNFGEWQSQYYA